jgi:hypothetical protein
VIDFPQMQRGISDAIASADGTARVAESNGRFLEVSVSHDQEPWLTCIEVEEDGSPTGVSWIEDTPVETIVSFVDADGWEVVRKVRAAFEELGWIEAGITHIMNHKSLAYERGDEKLSLMVSPADEPVVVSATFPAEIPAS